MGHVKKILVGIDFSPCSAAALRQAVRIAAWQRASVTALHVVEIPAFAIPDGMFAPVEAPPLDLLVDVAREQWSTWPAAREVGSTVTFETVVSLPRMELLDRVAREGFDLLIVGAHNRAHGIGPTASACVQRADTKVLVVREQQTGAFRSVVACIDFSETSRLALEQAVRFAAQDNASLHVLHVYDDPWRGLARPAKVRTTMPDLDEQYQHAVERYLHTFCEPFAHDLGALKATFHARRVDGHGQGILDFISREKCDLAVLGTRAKWNLRDFFWGSTAERVVREAPCSVLTVKPLGFRQDL